MLAAVLYGKEHVQLERVPIPMVGPGDILVRVRTALTCGTHTARTACQSRGRRASGTYCLGVAARMRVPLPAAGIKAKMAKVVLIQTDIIARFVF